jgi:hypothetical protein
VVQRQTSPAVESGQVEDERDAAVAEVAPRGFRRRDRLAVDDV